MKVLFKMDCGYTGTDTEEIVEFPDDITENEIEEELELWFWDNFNGSHFWEKIEE